MPTLNVNALMKNTCILLLVLILTACTESKQAEELSEANQLVLASTPLSAEANDFFNEMEQAIMADSFPNTTSVVVLRGGDIIYENYFGNGHRDVLNDTRSATKSLTALAVGAAVDEGKLSLDTRVFDTLKDLEPFQNDVALKREVTVEDFLTMSSAIDCNDGDMDSPGNEEYMYPKTHWARWVADLPTRDNYERDENGRGSFAYCTVGSFLLGQVLERVTEESLDVFFKRFLFDPLDIADWQWSRSPSGEYMTGGGLRLRALDLAKIGQMVLEGGEWSGRRVLSTDWITAATTPSVIANSEQGYGYQFWQRAWKSSCGPMKASYMSGNGGNNVLILPELDAVVVLTRQHYGQRGMHQQSIRLIENYVLAGMECE